MNGFIKTSQEAEIPGFQGHIFSGFFLAPELQFYEVGGANHMRILILFRLIFLAFLTCAVVIVLMPAMIFGGTRFLREVYAVFEHECARLRGEKTA